MAKNDWLTMIVGNDIRGLVVRVRASQRVRLHRLRLKMRFTTAMEFRREDVDLVPASTPGAARNLSKLQTRLIIG